MNMDCCCGINDDSESPQIFKESFQTARKNYVCCECKETIVNGESYHNIRGLWDGEWETYRTCVPCYGIRRDYCRCGFIFGELREAILECLGFDYTVVLDKDF